ncbi:RRP15-like protein [Argopecten irradians]|uniref:RRP15-like protein n=1 Tax=Argopecten irradians TaxID=31199 RepID=UPI00371EBDB9
MAVTHVESTKMNVDLESDDDDIDDSEIETDGEDEDDVEVLKSGDEESSDDEVSGADEVSDADEGSGDDEASGDEGSGDDEASGDEGSGDDEASGDDAPGKSQKAGLANAMAKILGKQLPKHTQAILAKGTSDKEINRKRQAKITEDDGTEKKSKLSDESKESLASLEKKRLWEAMGRTKPDPLERDKEKALQRMAQRGVVQLFNAVRKQQKILEEKSTGLTEAKKAKVVGNLTKGKFLDILKGTESNVKAQPDKELDKVKIREEPEGKWSILREDFMMGAKMKDWDQQSSDSDDGSNNREPSDDSDDG